MGRRALTIVPDEVEAGEGVPLLLQELSEGALAPLQLLDRLGARAAIPGDLSHTHTPPSPNPEREGNGGIPHPYPWAAWPGSGDFSAGGGGLGKPGNALPMLSPTHLRVVKRLPIPTATRAGTAASRSGWRVRATTRRSASMSRRMPTNSLSTRRKRPCSPGSAPRAKIGSRCPRGRGAQRADAPLASSS